MVALVFVSLMASTLGPAADAPRSGPEVEVADTHSNLSGKRLASTAEWSLDEAPTSREVAAIASYATTGTGVAMTVGFAYLLGTSTFAPPIASSIAGFSLAFLLMNFGPNVGDLLNGDLTRFGAHGGLRLLLVAVGVILRYAWIGWVASMVMDLRDAREAPARWAQRKGVADQSASRRDEAAPQVALLAF
jgi:hypothetical protein